MKTFDFEKGVETVPYQGAGWLAALCLWLFLEITGIWLFGSLVIFALIGHGLILYGHYVQKKRFKIILRNNTIIRETIFGRRSYSLNEVAFVGLTKECIYIELHEVYEKIRIIHLLLGDSHITFNPRLFYEEDSFLIINGTNEEQKEWKAMDETIISYLQENCKRTLNENTKKEILSSYEESYVPRYICYIFMWIIPCIPSLIEECLQK